MFLFTEKDHLDFLQSSLGSSFKQHIQIYNIYRIYEYVQCYSQTSHKLTSIKAQTIMHL